MGQENIDKNLRSRPYHDCAKLSLMDDRIIKYEDVDVVDARGRVDPWFISLWSIISILFVELTHIFIDES